jgi:acyl carrier protein
MSSDKLRDTINQVFNTVWREQKGTQPPSLSPDTLLLEWGIDSLGIAIIVTRLDEELGYDPFSIANDTPQTLEEFVALYRKYEPAS